MESKQNIDADQPSVSWKSGRHRLITFRGQTMNMKQLGKAIGRSKVVFLPVYNGGAITSAQIEAMLARDRAQLERKELIHRASLLGISENTLRQRIKRHRNNPDKWLAPLAR